MTDTRTPEPVAADLLWGADAIAAELGLTRRTVFHRLENGTIPARKVGQRWVASRARLRALVLGEDA